MVSSTISVPEPYQLVAASDRSQRASTVPLLEAEPARRSSPAKGAIIGILLGTGFWSALLFVVLKH